MNASYRILGVVPRLFEVLPRSVGPSERSPAVVDAARRLGVALGVAMRGVLRVVEDFDAVWVECGDGVHQCAMQHLAAAHGCARELCSHPAVLVRAALWQLLWQRLVRRPGAVLLPHVSMSL